MQSTTSSASGWQIDDLQLMPEQRQLNRQGRDIRLPVLSFDLLKVLAQAAPEPVSIEDLIDIVWSGVVVSDETVTQRVKLLRQALGDDGRNPRYIESVRGQGYRLIPVPVPISKKTGSSRFSLGLAAALLLILVMAVFTVRYLSTEPKPVSTTNISALTAADYIRQGNEYLNRHQQADNSLAISLFRQAQELEPDNLHAIAGLSFALTQSVTKFNAPGERLVESQALAESMIETYPEQHDGWLALAASLDGQGSVVPAIEAYEQAIAIAPEHWGAKASVAYLYQVHGDLVKALQLNLEVLEHADQLHYLNLQMGETLRLLGFDLAAEPWFQRTDELQPDNVYAAENRARFLLVNRRINEAEAVINNALERGLQRSELWMELGLISLLRNNETAATESFNKALQVDPENGQANTWRKVMQARGGELSEQDYQMAIAAIQTNIKNGDTWPTTYLQMANLQAAYGDFDAALVTLTQLFQAGFRDHRLLMLWPSFAPILTDEGFQVELHRIEQDIAHQRDAVLKADWVPRSLLSTQD